MPTLEQLTTIAYKRELLTSRRLATQHNLTMAVALQQTLQVSAGSDSLEELIAIRQCETSKQQARRDARKRQQANHRAHKAQLELPESDRWQAWFDGACHPNPGKMSIGVLLQSPLGARTELSEAIGLGDSSEAEYRALIALLQTANTAQVQKLMVYGDSRVVLDDVQSSGLRGSEILRPLRTHAQQLMATIPDLKMHWIPRARNAVADALSQAAICHSNVPVPLQGDSATPDQKIYKCR